MSYEELIGSQLVGSQLLIDSEAGGLQAEDNYYQNMQPTSIAYVPSTMNPLGESSSLVQQQ